MNEYIQSIIVTLIVFVVPYLVVKIALRDNN